MSVCHMLCVWCYLDSRLEAARVRITETVKQPTVSAALTEFIVTEIMLQEC